LAQGYWYVEAVAEIRWRTKITGREVVKELRSKSVGKIVNKDTEFIKN